MDGLRLKEKIELNYKEGEKVKVTPIGEVVGLDGRGFKIDPEMIIADIKNNDMHIPLDENHNFGQAVGWFDKESFEIRADGIYASLELNPIGVELVENKIYRYMSPVYVMGENYRVIGLDCVGLVNRPNLLNKELNQKDEKSKEKKLEELEKLKGEIESLKGEIATLKEVKPDEAAKATEENFKSEIEVLKGALKEMNTKMTTFFKKETLDTNDKAVTLSENEKKVADLLGIPHAEYLAQKTGA